MLPPEDEYMDDFESLPAALESYVPRQLLKNVEIDNVFDHDDLDYVQNVMDNSNDNLRMYGSAESLLENLKVYMEFPLSRKFFQRGLGSYDYTIPNVHRTLKKKVLYCKQDLLFFLQSCAYVELEHRVQKAKLVELIEYMKKHEERLSGCYEFVKYDHDTFQNFQKQFLFAGALYVFPENAEVTSTVEAPQIINYEKNKDFVKVFENLISKYPCLFLPNNETKNRNATAVVRVFNDGNVNFVMESELFAAINLKNQEQKPLECMDIDGHYRTIDYKHVLERYRDQINEIDFVYHPISMCLYATVPIVTPTGDHCILAINALHDILTETFLALGVFQKITRNTCHMIPKFIAILEKYFPSNIKYRYFMNLKLFRKLQEELEEFWKPIEDKPVKRVRDVGPQGFTVEDLKKELKYLGYTIIFPEITATASSVYTNILDSRMPIELETKDMFRAIRDALMFVIPERYPCLKEFVNRQKVCMHLRAKPCEPCLKAIKEAEARIEAEIKNLVQARSKPIPVISESEVPEHYSGLPDSISQKICKHLRENPCEACLKATTKTESATSNTPSIAMNDPVEAETKPIPAISKSEDPEHNPVSSIFNTHSCEKSMESSNEAEEEVIEINSKIVNYENEKKEPEEWEVTHLKVLENEVKTGMMLKSTGSSIALKIQFKKTKGEQSKIAPERSEFDVTIKAAVVSVNREKEEKLEAKVNGLMSQLVEKDKEIEELKIENLDEYKKLRSSILDLDKRVNAGLKEVDAKDSKIQELDFSISEIIQEKYSEIEKLKKQLALAAKENMKEMEQLKQNASKSANELKKLTAKISEKEAAENLLKRSNKGLLEKLQKSESSLKEITIRRGHLEAEVIVKNRMILELQKCVKQQVSEQEKAKKELETHMSTIRETLDKISRPEPKPEPVPFDSSENLSIQKLKNLFNTPGPIELAKEMVEKLISLSNRSEIHQMARYELQQYQGKVENYLRELEGKTEKIAEFPSFSDRFMSEYWKEIDENSQVTLSDTECFICFSEMNFDKEPTLKCEHCRKIVHFECASKWLKVHRSCAHCRREMLDPNEFPSLR